MMMRKKERTYERSNRKDKKIHLDAVAQQLNEKASNESIPFRKEKKKQNTKLKIAAHIHMKRIHR